MQLRNLLPVVVLLSLSCRLGGDEPLDSVEGRSGTRGVVAGSGPYMPRELGSIRFASDHAALDEVFRWAREQSLAYVFEGDPVGKWFEAALPGREAFCMRDVAHQAYGAMALGLWEHTRNMMGKFAESIAESRQWTSYWEIDRLDRPAPVDYRSDEDFWYNLPANFDIVETAVRVFHWTGDVAYLDDPVFLEFYRRSMNDYVAAWDPDGDGLMESPPSNGFRGIPSYWEGRGPRATTGGDLVAAQFSANAALSDLMAIRGDAGESERYLRAASHLRDLYNREWWAPELGRFHTSILEDGSFDDTHIPLLQILPVYYGIVESGPRRDTLLANLAPGEIVEVNAYLAEAFYRVGEDERAFQWLMRQVDPDLPRREYPENPFTVVGTVTRYLMGVSPWSSLGVVETRSRLPGQVSWAELTHVPTFVGPVAVRHEGRIMSRLTNEGEGPVRWRATFQGAHETLDVDGASLRSERGSTEWGDPTSSVEVDVLPGESVTVQVVGGMG
jgi:hypothetical protein